MPMQPTSDDAMKACRRVQAALRAMAEDNRGLVLREINEASDAESRWMISQLLAQVDSMAGLLATYAKKGSTRSRVLHAAADGMESDIAETGAAVVIDEAMRRDGLL